MRGCIGQCWDKLWGHNSELICILLCRAHSSRLSTIIMIALLWMIRAFHSQTIHQLLQTILYLSLASLCISYLTYIVAFSIFKGDLCVYVCFWVCTCVYIPMEVRKWHQVCSLCWQPLSFFFQTGFLTSAHWWPYSSWPVNPGDLPVSPSQALFRHMWTVTPSFVCVCWGFELSQVFTLSWRENSSPSYLSIFNLCFFLNIILILL